MEYQLKKELCPTCEAVFEGTSEQPVDLDISLPDYCPDIERLLKCRICPTVSGKTISGDRLEVEGTALITLYYLDSKKKAVRYCEHNSPFSCSFKLRPELADPVAVVKLRTDYLNCRAVGPRRVDIHGAFTVCAVVYARTEQEFCSGIEGSDIQQKTHSEGYSRLCGTGQQIFSITETLDIGQGKGSPEGILRSGLTVRAESCKALTDKLMVNGEAVLHLLYVTDVETGAADTMTFHIPFTQVLDVQGVTSETVNELRLDVMNFDASLKSEYDENSTLVTLDARICATVIATEPSEMVVVDDAYSTDYELELTSKPCSFTELLSLSENSLVLKEEAALGENGITQMMDVWCESVSSVASYENDALTIRGKVLCAMLALDSEGTPFYAERALEFSYSPEISVHGGTVNARVQVTPLSVSFRITGDNTIELKAELRCAAAVFSTRSCKAVTAAQTSEERRRQKDSAAALTIYYADEGENLWGIARQYCTSVEALRLENELTEDVFTGRTMLLIPV